MKTSRHAWAPGKVILLGEHAVVYGHTALAASIDRGVTARVSPADAPVFELPDGLSDAHAEALSQAIVRAFQVTGKPRVRLTLESELPLSAGLGSSGALSVAVARALLGTGTYAKVEPVALAMEKIFHGTPSGVDHMTSSRGGLVSFKNARAIAVKCPVPLHAVVAFAGSRRSTRETVADLRSKVHRWSRRYHRQFHEIGLLAEEGASALRRGDLELLGDLMNMNHGVLSGLGLSSAANDSLVALLRSWGAYGAKLTGAGGDGGAVIGLFARPRPVVTKLRAAHVECFATRLGDRP